MQVIEVVYRERPHPWGALAEPALVSAADVARVMTPLLYREVVEVCAVVCLDARHRFLGYHELSRGSLASVPIEARQVFQAALLANAAAVILVHNHPSGDPSPSPDDRVIYKRVKAAGDVMEIEVLDSVIVAGTGCYSSLREDITVGVKPENGKETSVCSQRG